MLCMILISINCALKPTTCINCFLIEGGDDRRILLWNVENSVIGGIGKPTAMNGEHHSNIFCIAFDESNKKILSGG